MAVADAYTLGKNTTLTVASPGVLANDMDADGNPMTAVAVAAPAHGSLTLNTNGGFVYTPVSNYFGADSFTYQAVDAYSNSLPATVSLTITNIIRPPVAVPDAYTLGKNTTLTVASPGVLANDMDADGNPMTAVAVAAPAPGTLTLNTNGGFVYSPLSNYFGADSFTYMAVDAYSNSLPATVSLTITNIIRPPVAVPDAYTLGKNTSLTVASPGVLANDMDADGNPMTAVAVAAPAHGTLTLNTNGGFVYSPLSNYFGADSFTYMAVDAYSNSLPATVSLTITNIIRPPVAVADAYTLGKNTTLTVASPGVLANDMDADGNPMTAVAVAAPPRHPDPQHQRRLCL